MATRYFLVTSVLRWLKTACSPVASSNTNTVTDRNKELYEGAVGIAPSYAEMHMVILGANSVHLSGEYLVRRKIFASLCLYCRVEKPACLEDISYPDDAPIVS